MDDLEKFKAEHRRMGWILFAAMIFSIIMVFLTMWWSVEYMAQGSAGWSILFLFLAGLNGWSLRDTWRIYHKCVRIQAVTSWDEAASVLK